MTIFYTCPRRGVSTHFSCNCMDNVTIIQCPACCRRHEYDHETEEIISHSRVGKIIPWFGIVLIVSLAILGFAARFGASAAANN